MLGTLEEIDYDVPQISEIMEAAVGKVSREISEEGVVEAGFQKSDSLDAIFGDQEKYALAMRELKGEAIRQGINNRVAEAYFGSPSIFRTNQLRKEGYPRDVRANNEILKFLGIFNLSLTSDGYIEFRSNPKDIKTSVKLTGPYHGKWLVNNVLLYSQLGIAIASLLGFWHDVPLPAKLVLVGIFLTIAQSQIRGALRRRNSMDAFLTGHEDDRVSELYQLVVELKRIDFGARALRQLVGIDVEQDLAVLTEAQRSLRLLAQNLAGELNADLQELERIKAAEILAKTDNDLFRGGYQLPPLDDDEDSLTVESGIDEEEVEEAEEVEEEVTVAAGSRNRGEF